MNKQVKIKPAHNGYIVEVGNPDMPKEISESLDRVESLFSDLIGGSPDPGEEWKRFQQEDTPEEEGVKDGIYIFTDLGQVIVFLRKVYSNDL